ncbi:hypothetical protein B0H14DRAFT_2734008 [Mycena olivaceomarginata]|nr:hypothetical protein B0H14DRAFT_2734008 [Mycena olivaceomarginata]
MPQAAAETIQSLPHTSGALSALFQKKEIRERAHTRDSLSAEHTDTWDWDAHSSFRRREDVPDGSICEVQDHRVPTASIAFYRQYYVLRLLFHCQRHLSPKGRRNKRESAWRYDRGCGPLPACTLSRIVLPRCAPLHSALPPSRRRAGEESRMRETPGKTNQEDSPSCLGISWSVSAPAQRCCSDTLVQAGYRARSEGRNAKVKVDGQQRDLTLLSYRMGRIGASRVSGRLSQRTRLWSTRDRYYIGGASWYSMWGWSRERRAAEDEE